MKEWSDIKQYNPFNSMKVLAQVYRWRQIKRSGVIPPPSTVTIDPINRCNLKCLWCNSSLVIKNRTKMIPPIYMSNIVDGLGEWTHNEWPVESVCIAGGGEPLLYPDIDHLIDRLTYNGIEVGIVTNGTLINRHIEALSKCTWVGVSVDTGYSGEFFLLKGVDLFHDVISGMKNLIEYSKTNDTYLGLNRPGNGVSYKYLLHPLNINTIEKSVKLAKEIGCKNFHLRPVGVPWNELLGNNWSFPFTGEHLKILEETEKSVRKLESKDFGVYLVTHKFDALNRRHKFDKCYAIFMTCAITPPRSEKEKFCLGLCCDRRGDPKLEVFESLYYFNDFSQVKKFWGSPAHWIIFDQIKLEECPRCTYQPHNQVYEEVILNDSMTYKFI